MMQGSYTDERRRARGQMRGEQSDVDHDRGIGGPWILLGGLLLVAALVAVVLAGGVAGVRTNSAQAPRARRRADRGRGAAASVARG